MIEIHRRTRMAYVSRSYYSQHYTCKFDYFLCELPPFLTKKKKKKKKNSEKTTTAHFESLVLVGKGLMVIGGVELKE